MAVVHKDFESFAERQKKFDIGKLPYPVYLLLGFILAFLFNYLVSRKQFILAIAILVVVFLIIKHMCSILRGDKTSEDKINESGAIGERKALTQLQCLDYRYHIIPNAVLHYNEKHSEIDTIIVGPTGVFIVEIKNHKGIISGSTADENLQQTKYGNIRRFYNPCKQVGTHRYTLNGVLEKNEGIHVHIHTCVYFCNDEVRLEIENDPSVDCKVVSNIDELLTYIKNSPVEFKIDEDIKKTVDCILSAK